MNSDEQYLRSWRQILEHSSKSSTLKFALARALLDICGQIPVGSNGAVSIAKQKIAYQFLRYYWWQTFRYHLRQTTNPKGLPKIIEILQDLWPNPLTAPQRVKDIPPEQLSVATSRIQRECFNNVIPRFHRIRGNQETAIHFYQSYRGYLLVQTPVIEFFHRYQGILRQLTLYQWTLWLENINNSPKLASKVSLEKEPERKRLNPFLKILSPSQDRCFYCQTTLVTTRVHVDHFVPWSYIFEDSLWNLVLTCESCNLSKNNVLPARKYLANLIERNKSIVGDPSSSLHNELFHSVLTFPGNSQVSFVAGMKRLFQGALDDGFIGNWEPKTARV